MRAAGFASLDISCKRVGSTFFSDNLADNNWDLSDGITWAHGAHTFKFGGDARLSQFNVTQFIDPGATINFRNEQTSLAGANNTGWPIASLITGATEWSFVNYHGVQPSWKQWYPAMFANDDWKVTRKLTLNLGLRYELPFPRTDRNDRLRGFDPNVTNPITGTRGALVSANATGALKAADPGMVPLDTSDIAPRVGFAYAVSNTMAVRGGYGIYYSPLIYGFGGGNSITEGFLGYNTTDIRTPLDKGDPNTSAYFLSSFPAHTPIDPTGQFIGSDVQYFDPNYRTGRTQQWSLDIQQEFPGNFALLIGYIGSHGTRLRSDFTRLNALPLNDLKLGAPLLQKNLSDVTASDRSYASSVGVTIPAAPPFATFTGSVAQAIRPFPQYGRVTNLLESRGASKYNALNAKLTRRFTQGFQFGFSYTWSKLETNAAEDLFGGSPITGVVQNPFDLRSLWSVSPNSATHVGVFNYIWELPFGKGKPFLNHGGIANVMARNKMTAASAGAAGMPNAVSPPVSAASWTPMPPGTGATFPTMPAPTCTTTSWA